jgi:hypothetical protein
MSVLGVVTLNVLFLVAGSGILWAVRGWTTWREYLELGGIAYVCGLSSAVVIGTLVLIWGASLSPGAILLITGGIAVVGALVGWRVGRPFPRRTETWSPQSLADLLPLAIAIVTATALASFFREARIQPLTAWDAWGFWMTKAKAIYYFGGLDPSYFEHLWGPSYPIFAPTLAAMNFQFMGSADTTTLGVQWWLLAVAFVWAGAGILRRIAPPTPTWLFLALFVVLPQLDARLLERKADWPLDIFFALAACALLAWILTDERWLLAVYGLTLAATLATKREGQLLAVCLVVAGIAASGFRSRRTWAAIAGVALLAYLPAIPWRIWWTSRHLQSDTPPGGLLHATFANIGKAPAAFHLVVRLMLEYHFWLAATPLALVAAVLCLWQGDRRVPVFFLVAFGLAFVGWAWENWAYVSPSLPISTNPAVNPTNRTVASLVLLSIVTAPVLIGQLLAQRAPLAVAVLEPANTMGSASATATNP